MCYNALICEAQASRRDTREKPRNPRPWKNEEYPAKPGSETLKGEMK